jgi:uncharacterized membrane protein
MRRNAAELAAHWLKRDISHLGELERNVVKSAAERLTLSRDTNRAFKGELSTGDRLADAIAKVGGSWSFITGFIVFLLAWTLLNAWLLGTGSFDPYPFIFLNLVLSMIAALQAPIIMMSQNRQAERDRIDATHDYEVNLKAEIEIMALHEKLDELRHQEIVAIHDDIRRIVDEIARMAGREPSSGARAG